MENDAELSPHQEIAQLEARIERLGVTIESCRRFMRASRVAVGGGAVLLIVLLFGAVRFDPMLFALAIALVLGGLVLLGSNSSTAKQSADQIAKAEARRAELIGTIGLRVVSEQPTLH